MDTALADLLAATVRGLGHTVTGLDELPPRSNARTADPAQWAKDLLTRVGPRRIDPVQP